MRASAPDAPPLSDTTIGCFIRLFFWMAAWIIRAIWSEAPPAPAATTISTGLVGSQAALDGLLNARPARAPAKMEIAFLMSLLLLWWFRLGGLASGRFGAARQMVHRRIDAL